MGVQSQRLSKVAKELNVGVDTMLEFLAQKGVEDLNRNSKISSEIYSILVDEYQPDKKVKDEAVELKKAEEEQKEEAETVRISTPKMEGLKIVSKVDLSKKPTPIPEKKLPNKSINDLQDKTIDDKSDSLKVKKLTENQSSENDHNEKKIIRAKAKKLDGPTIISSEKIDLTQFDSKKKKPVASSSSKIDGKRKRKRVLNKDQSISKVKRKTSPKVELTPEEIQKQVRENLAKLQGGGKNKGAKLRREKRQARKEQEEIELIKSEEESKVIQVTEFVTTAEFAQLMNVDPTDVISACFTLGMMVTQNQRLDAETLSIVSEEFGYTVEFVGAEVQESILQHEDSEDELFSRAPIVTVMGHVDHGKTSLLDYIRKANVISGEAGGITQHVGAYEVDLNGKKITFLDTPGHEAFTAMRARGAQVTDVVIIVVAADDQVMPQTKEAISHAQAAGVPMVFAINKVDRETANSDKIKEQLSSINILLEDWGGKFQSQEISAKTGQGITELLEKVLLEADMLDLKANPNKNAIGTVLEASLDRGKGYLTTILVEAGTLRLGDYVLAGCYSGKVKALLDEREGKMSHAGPSTPAVLLGLNGAAQAGDKFNVMQDEREAKNIATKRMQLQREQGVRTQKHITLDEIGRRLALGEFKELNIIIKGDVDGSIEALSDSLQKLSTDSIAVNIIHKSVGQISESVKTSTAVGYRIVVRKLQKSHSRTLTGNEP